MKAKIFQISIILLFFIACKNENIKSKNSLSKIDFNKIEIVEIKKKFSDSISVKLKSDEIKKLTNLINETNNAELRKASPRYWLIIKLKNDSILTYKVTDNYLGENDLYIRIKDKDYFKNIYENNQKSKYLIDYKIPASASF